MVLPAKSILCVGCHAATLSVNDAVTIPSLVVFLVGLAVAMSLWLSGTGNMIGGLKTVFSSRILLALESLLVDTVLQRRLLRQSAARWAIHSLIFLPFVIRFAWGAVALAASWTGARGAWFVMLIDKNHPVNALLFDLTGLSVLVGVCAAIARGIATRRQRLPGLPGQDHAALAVIGSVVVIGFVLEGMRMAMTGVSGRAAFLGYIISGAFTAGPALGRAYGYVWYLHAALTGAFVAYLPFSRMFHILVAPVALAARAVRRDRHAAHVAGD
jgi:nitrate reductase gamma subunit